MVRAIGLHIAVDAILPDGHGAFDRALVDGGRAHRSRVAHEGVNAADGEQAGLGRGGFHAIHYQSRNPV